MSRAPKPLVVLADDDQLQLRVVQHRLVQWGYRVGCVATKAELLKQLADEEPAVLVLDIRFGEHNGVELLGAALEAHPGMVVLMCTAFGSIDSAVAAMKLGAYDYLTKPVDFNRLQVVLEHALEKRSLRQKVDRLERLVADTEASRPIWGNSPGMAQVRELIATVAGTDATVLILGESGTGKELVARSLHEHSARRAAPLVPVNLAALPRELAESMLFGHEKGAFTGADQTQLGCCEAADGGTLFLDEVGEMELGLQAKLLRFLQERTVQRVGSTRPKPVNARIVAATNRDLVARVRDGQFREDLFYRLNVIPITIPPLRERPCDIPLLVARFLERTALRYRKDVLGLTPAATAAMTAYHWPGNIRQLENVIERLVILSRGPEIDVTDLPPEMASPGRAVRDNPARETPFRETPAGPGAVLPLTPVIGSVPPGENGMRAMDQIEKQAILDALSLAMGNVREAAKILGLAQATIYRKIKRYGIILEELGRIPLQRTDSGRTDSGRVHARVEGSPVIDPPTVSPLVPVEQ